MGYGFQSVTQCNEQSMYRHACRSLSEKLRIMGYAVAWLKARCWLRPPLRGLTCATRMLAFAETSLWLRPLAFARLTCAARMLAFAETSLWLRPPLRGLTCAARMLASAESSPSLPPLNISRASVAALRTPCGCLPLADFCRASSLSHPQRTDYPLGAVSIASRGFLSKAIAGCAPRLAARSVAPARAAAATSTATASRAAAATRGRFTAGFEENETHLPGSDLGEVQGDVL